MSWPSISLFEGEVWKQEIEHLGFKAQYSNIYEIKQTNFEKLVSKRTITGSEQNFYEIWFINDSLLTNQTWEIEIVLW